MLLDARSPSTMGEGFIQESRDGLPEGMDASAPVAWSGGQPSVFVLVFRRPPRETLVPYKGPLRSGSYTVTWNGTDAVGRQVAIDHGRRLHPGVP